MVTRGGTHLSSPEVFLSPILRLGRISLIPAAINLSRPYLSSTKNTLGSEPSSLGFPSLSAAKISPGRKPTTSPLSSITGTSGF